MLENIVYEDIEQYVYFLQRIIIGASTTLCPQMSTTAFHYRIHKQLLLDVFLEVSATALSEAEWGAGYIPILSK